MTISAVILLIVCFSCSVFSETIKNPKLPELKYDANGTPETTIASRIVGGTPAQAGEFQGKNALNHTSRKIQSKVDVDDVDHEPVNNIPVERLYKTHGNTRCHNVSPTYSNQQIDELITFGKKKHKDKRYVNDDKYKSKANGVLAPATLTNTILISIQQAAYYPYYISHFCGGTLIHTRHVLTAAHCVTTDSGAVRSPSFFILVGDDMYLNSISVSRQFRTASHVFVHPQYTIDGILNDVAVIRASSAFLVSTTFSPVARIENSPTPGYSCSVAGWGTIYFEGPLSYILLRIDATVIERSVCNGDESYEGYVKNGMFCAGSMAGGIDACQGDSGGGLICGEYIAGIVSWGAGCALPNLPGVYTDVALYNNWIDGTIIWDDGQHENIPTPTTVIVDTTNAPNDSAATLFSLNLICAAALIQIVVQQQ